MKRRVRKSSLLWLVPVVGVGVYLYMRKQGAPRDVTLPDFSLPSAPGLFPDANITSEGYSVNPNMQMTVEDLQPSAIRLSGGRWI